MVQKPFLILGHRGCRRTGIQQNSYTAFLEALRYADGLETDASQSSDGIVYLIHDTTFLHQAEYTLEEHLQPESAAQVAGRRMDEMLSDEIDTLRLLGGEPIPRLEGLLRMFRDYPNATLNIELKADNSALPVIETLHRGVRRGDIRPEQIIVTSYNLAQLPIMRRYAPEFRIGALYSVEDDRSNLLYPWSGNTTSCYVPFGREALVELSLHSIDPDFISLTTQSITVENCALIQEVFPRARLMAWPWIERMPETDETLHYLMPFAVDCLLHSWITDEPRLRKAALLSSAP